ncbi:thiamine pyrophosphate-dependent enzyme [Halalkalicoccus salilacus]|uniref:thiamine pyrophosphate-dependent enzyme n=1 Tax=Halalkalicoccus sp. GCM10025704 TaxID=3252662 RepID=UPI003606C9A1
MTRRSSPNSSTRGLRSHRRGVDREQRVLRRDPGALGGVGRGRRGASDRRRTDVHLPRLGGAPRGASRDGIVVSSAGQPQETTNPQFPVYEPRTNVSCGGFSTMGFGVSAAIGAKLARPESPVVDIEGDGSFLMCNQEVACAVEHDIDVTWLILNNHGWKSIRNLQVDKYGWDRVLNTPFNEETDVDYMKMAEAFNVGYTDRVVKPENLGDALGGAIEHDGPAIVEAFVEPDNPDSGAIITGEWDLADLEPTEAE